LLVVRVHSHELSDKINTEVVRWLQKKKGACEMPPFFENMTKVAGSHILRLEESL
jgi:hypothetical protein